MKREYLIRLRKQRGLTQAKAAKAYGIGEKTLCQLERGQQKRGLYTDTLILIANGLGISMAKLLDAEIRYIRERDGV